MVGVSSGLRTSWGLDLLGLFQVGVRGLLVSKSIRRCSRSSEIRLALR